MIVSKAFLSAELSVVCCIRILSFACLLHDKSKVEQTAAANTEIFDFERIFTMVSFLLLSCGIYFHTNEIYQTFSF
jgi:hypothetical protein